MKVNSSNVLNQEKLKSNYILLNIFDHLLRKKAYEIINYNKHI